MRTVNSFSTGTSSAPSRLQRPVEFPDGQRCTRIINETTLPLKNNGGASYTLSQADALDIMQKFYATTTMGFGDVSTEIVDDALSFDDMRQMHIVLTGRDVIFNGKELRNYSSSDGDAISIAAGATVNAIMELIRTFEFSRFGGARILTWCPGADQMRQLHWSFVRGGQFTANAGNIVQNGNADNVVLFDTVAGDARKWVQVPRLFRNNDGGLVHKGPAGGGGLLALYEVTAAGGSGALASGLVSLTRKGDSAIHEQVTGKRLSTDSQLKVPVGAFDPNGLVTMIHQLEPAAELADVPTSDGWEFVQHSQYLSPMQTRWLYVPPNDKSAADRIGPNLAKSDQPPVKLAPAAAAAGDNVPEHTNAITGFALIGPDDPRYQLAPGRVYESGRAAKDHIPQKLINDVKIATSNAGVAGPGRQTLEAQGIARFIPGGSSVRRGTPTAVFQDVKAQVS